MINVVFACNDGYFDAAFVTTLSILRRTKETCKFYLLSGDFSQTNPKFTMFSKQHEQQMNEYVRSYNPNNTFEVIDCKPMYDETFGDLVWRKWWINHWTPYTILRVFIPRITKLSGKTIYLDLDTMLNDDIKKINDVDLGPYEIAATRDIATPFKYFKRYYNAGVLLIDVDKIRNNKTFDKVIDYVKRRKPLVLEQDAINKICRIMRFPGNDYRFNWQKDGIKDDTIVKHFWGYVRLKPSHRNIKQWEVEKVQNILNIHNWDEDYKIYLKEKRSWNK